MACASFVAAKEAKMRISIVAASAGLALAGAAVPAAAQYSQQKPSLAQAIVNQALGYGRYPYGNYGYNQYRSQRAGIDRCARAVEQRLGGNNWYSGNKYRRYRNSGRVEGITRVERKNYGLKVSGVASSGYGGYQGYGQRYYGNYGYGAGADLRFECKVSRSGQIRDIDIKRRTATWRGY
jgi:hypothetical protein